jgi:ABC-type branched-subunit amino acid transport system ATPase component
MRFTWAQHQQAARTISAVQQQNSGTALALMGIALLLLLQDLEDAG